MKEKGIEQFIDTARYIKSKYSNTAFHICGNCDDTYKPIIDKYHDEGLIIYHGRVSDIREVLAYSHCLLLPTYYPEGMCNALLESSASARPIITTTRPGCSEVIDDGINGYAVKERDSQSVIDAVEKFINLTYEEKKEMGLAGRSKVESQFNRQIVVDSYLKTINAI